MTVADEVVVGEITLPRSIEVDVEVLGREFNGSLDGRPLTLCFPGATSDQWNAPIVGPPGSVRPRGQADSDAEWGQVSRFRGETPWGVDIRAVAFRTTSDVDLDGSEFASRASRFGQRFDEWWADVEAWLSAWAGYPVRREPRSAAGEGSYRSESGTRRSGWGHLGEADLGFIPFTSRRIRRAIELASSGDPVPASWSLLLSAQASRDPRRSVIEAASAVEVALDMHLDVALHERGLSDDQVEAILSPVRNVGAKIHLAEALDPPQSSLEGEVSKKVSAPRNLAVHKGVVPTAGQQLMAIQTAWTVLTRYADLSD